MRNFLLMAALVGMASLALADPTTLGVPDSTCQAPAEWRVHDYGPPLDYTEDGLYAGYNYEYDLVLPRRSAVVPVEDGSLEEHCRVHHLDTVYVPYLYTHKSCEEMGNEGYPPIVIELCRAAPIQFDGDLEFGFGGGFLASSTGPYPYHGSLACYYVEGHHPVGGTVTVEDMVFGSLVAFSVSADYENPASPLPPPPLRGIDTRCGDGVIEACNPYPPTPSSLPQPVGGVVDTVDALVWGLSETAGCNPQDKRIDCIGSCILPFGPGEDGAYWVNVYRTSSGNEGLPTGATQGHIFL